MNNNANLIVVLIRVNFRLCAFSIGSIIETMRPLAVEAVPGLPPFVRGLSIVRGSPVPVVELATLLGDEASPAGRWILLRAGERRVAVAVSEVLAIRPIGEATLRTFPPLLDGAFAGLVTALEHRDQDLLLVLQASRLVPEDVWRQLEVNQGSA